MTESEQAPPGVDPAMPTPARLYNYYLGGTSYFPIDREVAEELRRLVPETSDSRGLGEPRLPPPRRPLDGRRARRPPPVPRPRLGSAHPGNHA